MPTPNVPSDLIQEVLDILRSDNQEVEVYTQGIPNGGVLCLEGTVYGLTGDNMLLLDHLRIKGTEVPSESKHQIHLSSVIQIKTIGA